MPRDASTNFARFWLLGVIIYCSMLAGTLFERGEIWNAAFAGAFVVLASAILGEFLYVRGEK